MSKSWDRGKIARLLLKTYERRSICLVDKETAGRFKEVHIQSCVQCCRKHITRTRAEWLVKQGDAEWVGKGKNAICFSDPREWRVCDSAGFDVLQMVA